jgi:uncharacterized protein YvpB
MRVPFFRVAAAVAVTLAILSTPKSGSASSTVLLTGFPLLKQQHMLTCEASAASMATRAVLTEAAIMAHLPRSSDPNLGFRGNPDGLPDPKLWNYGVYAAPLQTVLSGFGYTSTVLTDATNDDVKAYIRKGWPVILWLTYALKPATPRLAVAAGRPFVLVPHEHAILAIGYGDGKLIANDPWIPQVVRYGWGAFDRSWALFRNMALAVDPCPAPAPVSGLTLAKASTERLVWTWSAAANAAQYQVTMWQRSPAAPAPLFIGQVTTPRYALQSPTPGSVYEIVVRSVSQCGEESSSRKVWVSVPILQPTASATLAPGGTPPANPAPSATARPSPTATVHA